MVQHTVYIMQNFKSISRDLGVFCSDTQLDFGHNPSGHPCRTQTSTRQADYSDPPLAE